MIALITGSSIRGVHKDANVLLLRFALSLEAGQALRAVERYVGLQKTKMCPPTPGLSPNSCKTPLVLECYRKGGVRGLLLTAAVDGAEEGSRRGDEKLKESCFADSTPHPW